MIFTNLLKYIPGFDELKPGHYRSFVTRFGLFALPLILILFNGSLFIDGLMSFAWSSLAWLQERETFLKVFNVQIIEYWIASFFAVTWIGGVLVWQTRRIRMGQHPSQYETLSSWQMILHGIRQNDFARFFFVVLMFLYVVAFMAPWLVPSDPNAQQDIVVTKYAAPLKRISYLKLRPTEDHALHNETPYEGQRVLRQTIRLQKRLLTDKDRILYVNEYEMYADGVRYKQGLQAKTLPLSELVSDNEAEFAGHRIFLLGSDKFGRDIFSRLIYGSRISLSIGLLAMLIAVTLGTIVGAVAGYFGKRTDTVLMRWVDLMLAFPNLFLILMIVALFGNSIFLIVVILGLTGWMGVARIVRGQFLSLREMEYIQAARAMGFGHARIIFKHLIPNAMAPVIVAATLRLGGIILVEAGLSFLGVGVQPPTASWGNMVADGRDTLLSAWWISTFPGIAIVLTVICFNVIGDGLRDALDPRLKQ